MTGEFRITAPVNHGDYTMILPPSHQFIQVCRWLAQGVVNWFALYFMYGEGPSLEQT